MRRKKTRPEDTLGKAYEPTKGLDDGWSVVKPFRVKGDILLVRFLKPKPYWNEGCVGLLRFSRLCNHYREVKL